MSQPAGAGAALEGVRAQAPTHHLGLYFMASRGSRLAAELR